MQEDYACSASLSPSPPCTTCWLLAYMTLHHWWPAEVCEQKTSAQTIAAFWQPLGCYGRCHAIVQYFSVDAQLFQWRGNVNSRVTFRHMPRILSEPFHLELCSEEVAAQTWKALVGTRIPHVACEIKSAGAILNAFWSSPCAFALVSL